MIYKQVMKYAAALVICVSMQLTTSASAAQGDSAPLSLFVLGDSVAFGQGASDPSKSAAFLLYSKLREGRPGTIVTNHAIGGARIADVTRLEFDAIPSHVDIVIVEAGANDVVRGAHAAAVARDMDALLTAVHAHYPHALVVVCGIPDLSISPIFLGAHRRSIAVLAAEDDRAVRATTARHNAVFVDVYRLSHGLHGHASDFLGSDEFHPSDRGHAAIAALIERRIADAFARVRSDLGK